MNNTCRNCEYFVGDRKELNGEGGCRRFPPTPLLVPTSRGPAIQGHYAPVTVNTSCGEFKAQLVLMN